MSLQLAITRGLPASGKTTWARQWVAEAPEGERRVRVNRDDLRFNLFGVYWGLEYQQEQAVTDAQQGAIKGLLRAGISVVVDDTNLRQKHARTLADLGAQYGAELLVHDLSDVALHECIRRDVQRSLAGDRAVGEIPIRALHHRYLAKGPLEPIERAATQVAAALAYSPDQSLPPAWIVDIDGTLARMSGRGPFEWARVGEDEPVPAVVDLVLALGGCRTIIFVSGRDAVCRPETNAWLARHIPVAWDELLMRPEGDTRRDDVVKEEIFWRDIAPRWNVLGVLDDRDRVVAMWRRLGLVCAQVAPGDF